MARSRQRFHYRCYAMNASGPACCRRGECHRCVRPES